MVCKVRIVSEGFGQAKIFINDIFVPNVRSANLSIEPCEVPTLTIELVPSELDIELEGVVETAEPQEDKVFLTLNKRELAWLFAESVDGGADNG